MRVISVTCFRNETDIIEPFIRHTACFCDEQILLNHGSTNECPEIVRQLQREGLPLRIIDDPSLGNFEIEHANRLLKFAALELSADWILSLDVDEFIQGAHDRSFLQAHVENETPCLKFALQTYYPQPDDPAAVVNPVERITSRLASEPRMHGEVWQYHVAVPGWLARKENSLLSEGKHYFLVDGVEAPHRILKEVRLAHFSLRSPVQHALKIASRQLQKFRHIAHSGTELNFYNKQYKLLRESYSSFAGQFHSMRVPYMPSGEAEPLVKDPIEYLGGPLRHTPPVPGMDCLVRDLLDLSEKLARSSPDQTHTAPPEAEPPAQLAIELASGPDPAFRQLVSHPLDRTQFQTFVFSLDCPPGTAVFHMHMRPGPGMIEINSITLAYGGSQPSRQVFTGARLCSMISVLQGGAMLVYFGTCRVMVSTLQLKLLFSGWNREATGALVEMVVQLRFEDRFIAPIFLSAVALKEIDDTKTALLICRRELESARQEIESLRNNASRAECPVGFVIDFTSSGNSFPFKQQGWSKAEAWGTWADGRKAVLKILLPEIPQGALWLNAKLLGFVHPQNPANTVRASINGEFLAAWTLKSTTPSFFRAEIDAGKITRKECEITFDISNPVSPRELGLSADLRLLGMGVVQLYFSTGPHGD